MIFAKLMQRIFAKYMCVAKVVYQPITDDITLELIKPNTVCEVSSNTYFCMIFTQQDIFEEARIFYANK